MKLLKNPLFAFDSLSIFSTCVIMLVIFGAYLYFLAIMCMYHTIFSLRLELRVSLKIIS